MFKFHCVIKLLCKWVVDETLIYYNWHLVMLESKILAMLIGGVNLKPTSRN
jgi:hypothetical protein